MGFAHAGTIGEANAVVNSFLHIISLMSLSFGKSGYRKTVTLSFPNHYLNWLRYMLSINFIQKNGLNALFSNIFRKHIQDYIRTEDEVHPGSAHGQLRILL
jgi:hypothetical protein